MTNAALALAITVYAVVYIIHSRFNFQFWPMWKQSITYAAGVVSALAVFGLVIYQA